jgi:hypothetical protein
MSEPQKTFEEALQDFMQLINSENSNYRTLPPAFMAACDKFIAETEYQGKEHQALGMHVEAIMKHFKGLS